MRSLLLVFVLLIANTVTAQGNWRLNDEWFEKHGSKGLQIGDSIPDISLGTVLNNYTGKSRFSDFRGKLVILDFWATNCTNCMAAFPKMEKLQQQFGDKIQIILVNPFETKEEIETSLDLSYLKTYKLPNLPCIVADKSYASTQELMYGSGIFKLFPIRSVPHHVWIDANGIIKVRGWDLNTHEQKIKDILGGKEVFSMNMSSTIPSLAADRKAPYYKQLGSLRKTPVAYGTFITPYNNELDGYRNEITDSSSNVRIRYFINNDILDMYIWGAVGADFFNRNILYSPVFGADFVVFSKGVDTSMFTAQELLVGKKLTDVEYMRAKFCLEQIVPISTSVEQSHSYMLEDLNRYFGQVYGIVGEIEKRLTPCYALIRTSQKNKVSTKFKDQSFRKVDTITNAGDEKFIRRQFEAFETAIQSTIRSNKELDNVMLKNKNGCEPYIVLNETDWNNKMRVDMILPAKRLKTIDELRIAIAEYDLDIVKVEREINFLVFKKVKKDLLN